MKTSLTFKSLLMILFIGFIGSVQFSSAQITYGLYEWNDADSTGHGCYGYPVNYYIMWSDTGSWVTGDTLDVQVNWGDGNVDSYPNNIISASFYAYISTISTQHTWSTPGIYYITMTANDHYGHNFTLMDSIEVVTNCGFILGNVLLDDGDAIYEPWVDLPGTGVPMIVTTSLSTYGAITDTWGYYDITNIDQTATTYHVEIDPAWLTANGFSVIDPVGGSYSFTTPPLTYTQYNFLLDCGGTYNDESVSGYGWGFTPNTDTGFVDIYLHSFSCSGTPANIDLSIDFDPILTPTTSTLGTYNVVGTTLTSTITGVNGWQWERIHFAVPAGTLPFTPLVFNINTNVTNYTDSYLPNNAYTINSMVLNSWDPNDKRTNVGSSIDAAITEEIQYNIRFQNEGSASANTVTIIDMIDSQLDLSTFGIVAQSHSMSYNIDATTRIVTFTFPQINLPPQSIDNLGSQGFVRYKIKENPGLPIGSELNNTAYIYFDSNPAIITNTTSNINTSLGVEENNGTSLKIYPQPASDMVYISGINAQDVTSISILDVNGKVVEVMNSNVVNEGISVSALASGMYFITVQTNNGPLTKKLCVKR